MGTPEPKIVLRSGCKIGRRATLSSRNRIVLEADVLLAPSVLIMDHNHEFYDTQRPIHAQGVTEGGKIFIERNCWLGHGAAIVCNQGELRGWAATAWSERIRCVTKSFPPFQRDWREVPARLLKCYDEKTGRWSKP